jgi:hypothetical protein
MAFIANRTDEFGVRGRYVIACTGESGPLSVTDCQGLAKLANHENGSLVIVGAVAEAMPDVPTLSLEELLGRLGGSVPTFLPLEPEYREQLEILGHNRLPNRLVGRADDLFEQYVYAGLQFLFQDKVVRYGQERRFEALPDGLVIGHRSPLILYDAKAYADGYSVTKQTIRQFGDYVRQFHQRYERYTGRVHAFLVISGHFNCGGNMQERSSELYADCQVPLCSLTATEMGKIVAMLAERPSFRQAIDWASIFSKPEIRADAVEKSLAARKRDGIIGP